jgi:Skp family chaperone for outer membrane proteins
MSAAKRWRACAGGAGLLLAAAAAGQGAPAARYVAVLDVDRVIETSRSGRQVLDDIRTLRERKEAELRGRAQEVAELQRRLAAGGAGAGDERLALERQVEDRVLALRRLQDDARREIEQTGAELLRDLERRLQPIVEQAARSSGSLLVFRKYEGGLVFADTAYEITDLVIARLDAATPARVP